MYVILNLEGYFLMKIFKIMVLLLLLGLTLQTAYFALIYKAILSTCNFVICFAMFGIVAADGGLEKK